MRFGQLAQKTNPAAAVRGLSRSKKLLATLVAAVALALAASAAGYASMKKTVTLSVDGHPTQVSSLGGTVGDVLAAQDIHVGPHDLVAPSADTPVSDGTHIAVRYGRPLDISVDGQHQTYWVTATDVADALQQLGLRFSNADLSTSRSAGISRQGLDLSVVTPKRIVVEVGRAKAHHENVPAMTVTQTLHQLGISVDKNDIVKPALGATVHDGDKIVVTRVRTTTKAVNESIGYQTITKNAPHMYRGHSVTVRSGHPGTRHVVYRIVFHNGHVVSRKAIRSTTQSQPVPAIVRVGTESRPAPAPTTNYASGSTVWDQLAQCESGGNWAADTGNGYYGGLQFTVSTWQAYGGSGYPNQASRETQIAIATKVRDASGGYGAWPACSQQLGLPQ